MPWGDDDHTLEHGGGGQPTPAPAPARSWGDDDGAYVPPKASRTKQTSQALGFGKGAWKGLDNAAMAMEAGADRLGVDTKAVNNLFGLPSAREAADRHATAIAASDRRPGMLGEVAGNIFGTIPAVIATKNPFIAGAAQGALLTDARDPGGVAGDALMGGALGHIGGKAVDAAADFIKPVIAPAVRRLSDAGVKLTPGMVRGGKAMVAEDKAMSRPLVGDAIRAGRTATQDTFNTASVNEALKPLGIKVPTPVKPGQDTIDYAYGEIGKAYDLVVPHIAVQLNGPEFAQNLATAARNLKPAEQKQLRQIVSNELGNGQLAGRALKNAQAEIRRLAGNFSRSQSANEQMLGDALGTVDDELSSAMIAQNPKYAPDLQRVNTAYRGFKIVADAASRADDGLINTGQLKQAVRRGDRSKDKVATARGKAFMQDFSGDAREVIPAQYPDSGTAGRNQAGNIFSMARGGADALGYGADNVYQSLRLALRPKIADPAAKAVKRLQTPATAALIASLQASRD